MEYFYSFACFQEVLDATVAQRCRFRSIVDESPNLILIQLDTWAGLGAVRLVKGVLEVEILIQKKKVVNECCVCVAEGSRLASYDPHGKKVFNE